MFYFSDLIHKRQLSSKTAAALVQSKFPLQLLATSLAISCNRNLLLPVLLHHLLGFLSAVSKSNLAVLSQLNINWSVKKMSQFQVGVSKTAELEY